jgi:hypothetical protein
VACALEDKRFFACLSLGVLVIVAWIQLIWATTLGPGVHEDSYSYMDTTWALLHGYGFLRDRKPMMHFPPGYPVLLAAAYMVVGDLVQAARYLEVLLYCINIALVGIIGYVLSEKNVIVLMAAPLGVMLSGELLVVFSTAASEGLFMASALGAFILLSMHAQNLRLHCVVCAGLCLGVASVTRYVGVTLLPAALAGVWFVGQSPRSQRVRECVLLSVLSLLPLVFWISRNLILEGTPTNRPLVFHPVTLGELKAGVVNLVNFYLPIEVSPWLKLGALTSVGAILGLQLPRLQVGIAAKTLLISILTFCLIYLAFVIASMSFFDAFTEFEFRILAPVAIFSMIFAFAVGLKLAVSAKRAGIRWLSGAFVVTILIANLPAYLRISADLHHNGYYYSHRKWSESESVAFVRSIPPNMAVYSNDRHALAYRVGRRVEMLPYKIHPLSRVATQDFAQSMHSLCESVRRGAAMVVYLDQKRWYFPTAEELQDICGFGVTRRFSDGVVLGRQ